MLTLRRSHCEEIFSQALQAAPAECCGLIGGDKAGARSVYPLRNVAARPESAYEAAPEELFAAQRLMRDRGEQLLAIYHSHPRANEPFPSEADVRLAYYPAAVYLIVGLAGQVPALRAFSINEHQQHWEEVEYRVVGE